VQGAGAGWRARGEGRGAWGEGRGARGEGRGAWGVGRGARGVSASLHTRRSALHTRRSALDALTRPTPALHAAPSAPVTAAPISVTTASAIKLRFCSTKNRCSRRLSSPRAVRGSISRVLCAASSPWQRGGHSSGTHIAVRLVRPTQRLGRAALERLSTWPCSGWGLPCRNRYRLRGGLLLHLFTLTCSDVESIQAV